MNQPQKANAKDRKAESMQKPLLGAMEGAGTTLGDLTEPIETDWEAARDE